MIKQPRRRRHPAGRRRRAGLRASRRRHEHGSFMAGFVASAVRARPHDRRWSRSACGRRCSRAARRSGALAGLAFVGAMAGRRRARAAAACRCPSSSRASSPRSSCIGLLAARRAQRAGPAGDRDDRLVRAASTAMRMAAKSRRTPAALEYFGSASRSPPRCCMRAGIGCGARPRPRSSRRRRCVLAGAACAAVGTGLGGLWQ